MTKLRVLSYNLHSLRDDRRALAEVVRGVAPDVAILQEAPRRFRWRQKSADLARDFELVVAGGGLPALGNLILTNLRVRPLDGFDIRYPLTPGRHMRGAAFVRCRVGRATFVAVGSHLSTDATERPAQAAVLKARLAEPAEPVVFAADLNENSGGAAWRTLADGLVDAAGADERHTYPCAAPRDRLDAVFVDPRVTVLSYEVVDTPAARLASDHFPVVVELDLPD
ncbi:endonuclease/exonuclease/phosphatase family protein [Dactylosporangium aurantiacum]|uniref:Endonuclease/exonuclease/phosphatase family protein n=1 Tax=Dactylosporangium aurantiacum TaxID=35754 RepID=A0A9Q9MBT5_9ACTN|nr:endonuclease/exonuclease/phosphatase family protein [Dactylosporangium aurantiacum]MDG6102440.1 endonuclease/exonuclease/phosphatase family protein [Dactylosporangium aurantiacum]UWZ53273.1 endonuclease/exonuclease/phosphatase family protein [Dactylosporangium aurantiacum]